MAARGSRGRGRGRGRDRRRRRRRGGGSDLGARIVTALPLIAVALTIVVIGGWLWVAGLIVVGLLCLHEAFELMSGGHPVRLAGFLGLIGLLLAAHLGGPTAVLGALLAVGPLTFLIATIQPRAGAPGLAVTYLGLVWIAIPLAHAVMLRDLPHGMGIVIDVLVGTFVGDTGAYLGGRAFGQRPLAPRISPNKTVEGLVCGYVAGVAAVWFAGTYQDWLSGTDAFLLGLAVAAAAPVGDLFESYLKRDRGVKDSGNVFGPHGGALDRLDAVLFSVVAGYYVWQAMV